MLRCKRVYKGMNCLIHYRFTVQRGITISMVLDSRNWNAFPEREKRRVYNMFVQINNIVGMDFEDVVEVWREAFLTHCRTVRVLRGWFDFGEAGEDGDVSPLQAPGPIPDPPTEDYSEGTTIEYASEEEN